MDMPDRLKPCPFCGGEAHYTEATEAGDGAYVVACSSCQASSMVAFASKDDPRRVLTDAWNRRADDWLPMESAPKDGTHVLLFDEEDGEVVIGCWGSSSTWVHVPGGWSVPSSLWTPLMAPPADWLILQEEIDALAEGAQRPTPSHPPSDGEDKGK